MKRWPVIILLIVSAPLILFGTIFVVVSPFLPQSNPTTPLVTALVVTYAIAFGIATVAQAYGYTLRDLLPEKTLREIDRERYKLLKSKDPNELRQQMKTSKERKDHDWAVAFAEALLKLRPKDGEALKIAGRASVELGDVEKAISFGARLVDSEKLNYAGHEILGDAYSELSEWDQAIAAYEQALTLVRRDFRSHILFPLSSAYLAAGNLEQAIAALQEYVYSQTDDTSRQINKQHLDELVSLRERLSGAQNQKPNEA